MYVFSNREKFATVNKGKQLLPNGLLSCSDASKASDTPIAFTANTRKKYSWPSSRSCTMYDITSGPTSATFCHCF